MASSRGPLSEIFAADAAMPPQPVAGVNVSNNVQNQDTLGSIVDAIFPIVNDGEQKVPTDLKVGQSDT